MANNPYNIPYKAYQSIEPCSNLYLKQKWDRSEHEHYVRRLKDVKVSYLKIFFYIYKNVVIQIKIIDFFFIILTLL